MPFFHVWFTTKRRKWLLRDDVLDAARELIKEIAREKGINLIESEAIVDHVHLLLNFEHASELPRAMMLLKGISACRIFERFDELKLDAGSESFWQTGYGSKLINEEAVATVQEYIRTQWDRLESYDRPSMPRGSARGTARLRE